MHKKSYIVIGAIFLVLNLAATTRANLVANTNDSGAGSLRQAIDDFNNDISGAPGAIVFSSLFNVPQTINLASEIVIGGYGGSLTINGPGANLLTVQMNGTQRIFKSNGGTLTIKGMTLRLGQGRGASSSINGLGSAIYYNENLPPGSGGSFTLDGVSVQENDGTGITTSSGAVYISGGINHRIINSTFAANTSNSCGAIDVESATLTVTNTTISGNSAYRVGGGVCVINSTV